MPILVRQSLPLEWQSGTRSAAVDLAETLRAPKCLMALLSAYLDESENVTEDGLTRVFAIGGYVAFPWHYDGLAQQWRQIVERRLMPHGIKRFHMSPFESRDKGFEKLSDRERFTLLRELMDVIHSCEIQPVAAALDMSEWDALPDHAKDNFQTPFYPMMQAIVDIISKRVRTSDDDPRFQFVFDMRTDIASECRIAYERMKERLPQLVGAPAFLLGEHVPELQAADIVAYDTCKAYRNQIVGDRRIRKSTSMLQEKRKLWFTTVKLGIRYD